MIESTFRKYNGPLKIYYGHSGELAEDVEIEFMFRINNDGKSLVGPDENPLDFATKVTIHSLSITYGTWIIHTGMGSYVGRLVDEKSLNKRNELAIKLKT